LARTDGANNGVSDSAWLGPAWNMKGDMTKSPDDLLRDLQRWFARQCDGVWEHHHGVRIETCDNPGWWVKVDLSGTGLESRPFQRIAENVDAKGFQQGNRWLNCYVDGSVWNGVGDETKLSVILQSFLAWASEGTLVTRGTAKLPLYADLGFIFSFVEDRLIPRFHLEGVMAGLAVSVFKVTGEQWDLLATGTVGEGGWVDLPDPINVLAGDQLVAVPE
jgi:hypothetical protein